MLLSHVSLVGNHTAACRYCNACSSLDILDALLIAFSAVWLVLKHSMGSSTNEDVGLVYRELMDSRSVEPFRRRVCMFRYMAWALRGILNNFVCGHRHPFSTASYDTVIAAVRLS